MNITNKTHTEKLADRILENLKKGYTLDSLKYSLIMQGHSRISVESAIQLANNKLAQETPLKEKPQITYKLISDNEVIKISNIPEKKGFFKWLFG